MKESIFNEICKEYGLTKTDSRFIKGSYWYTYKDIEICERSASGMYLVIPQLNLGRHQMCNSIRIIETEFNLRQIIESCIKQIKNYEIEKKIEDMNNDFE